MVMTPHEAVRQLVRNKVDYVPIARAEGRIATTLMLVYPPGIGTIVPGERLTERARPMLDYLLMFERSANLFPGFEAEIQGERRTALEAEFGMQRVLDGGAAGWLYRADHVATLRLMPYTKARKGRPWSR